MVLINSYNSIQVNDKEVSALIRLIEVSKNYPKLKENSLYRDLKIQLDGTDGRITVVQTVIS